MLLLWSISWQAYENCSKNSFSHGLGRECSSESFSENGQKFRELLWEWPFRSKSFSPKLGVGWHLSVRISTWHESAALCHLTLLWFVGGVTKSWCFRVTSGQSLFFSAYVCQFMPFFLCFFRSVSSVLSVFVSFRPFLSVPFHSSLPMSVLPPPRARAKPPRTKGALLSWREAFVAPSEKPLHKNLWSFWRLCKTCKLQPRPPLAGVSHARNLVLCFWRLKELRSELKFAAIRLCNETYWELKTL